ncbi:MAG: urea ABC transporter permease subunit UrtC [Acidimicrobiia bacterium]
MTAPTGTAPDVAASAPPGRRTSPLSRLLPGSPNPWVARLVLVAFAAFLFVLPGILGDPTRTRQWSEYLCYAMIAVGIDIAWGYGGMLVMGQGVFFGLGAYAMGMHLSLEQVGPGELPQFMALYSDYDTLPWLWKPFESFWFAAFAAVAIPVVVAVLLGLLVFTRRIRGPYFAILTQATALIMSLILVGQLQLTAGTNGLTNFNTVFGRSRYDSGTIDFLYFVAVGALLVVIVVARQIVRSRYGRLLVATRDGEDRVRFLGYDPARIKTLAFALSAAMAGLAGALAAPIIGLVAPNQFNVLPSILMVCWVAVGGRGTLWGAVLGALLVSWTKTTVSESRPEDWVYFQGLLFVVVVGFVPGGIAGLVRNLGRLVRRRGPGAAAVPAEVRPLDAVAATDGASA